MSRNTKNLCEFCYEKEAVRKEEDIEVCQDCYDRHHMCQDCKANLEFTEKYTDYKGDSFCENCYFIRYPEGN